MRLRRYFTLPLAAAIVLACASQAVADPPGSNTEMRFLLTNQQLEDPLATAVARMDDEAADDEAAEDDEAGEPYKLAETYEDFVGGGAYYGAPYLIYEDVPYSPQTAVRFGWWGVNTSGSKTKVGEWQGLDSSSPFWDVDGIRSDGYRTFDFFATGTENQTTQVGMHFYNGPGLTADVDYDRFLHRLDTKRLHPPFGGFSPNPPPVTTAPRYWAEDLDAGTDYAMRVQRLKADFKGDLTENIRWRLNVWGMQKEGTRQALSSQHCFIPPPGHPQTTTFTTCHVVSQAQSIDWLTMEIEPVIEARFGWLTVEYSRTMRSFQQNDELVVRPFTSGAGTLNLGPAGASNFVPENTTEIDRIKLGGQIAPDTTMYVLGHVGNTHNKFRESDRKFYGVDARVTNTTYQGLSVTGYGKTFTQNHSPDTVALNTRYPGQASLWLEPNAPQADPFYLDLVDRDYAAVGVRSRWRPFYDDCGLRRGLAVTSGYEYSQLERRNATYDLLRLSPPVVFTQPTTVTNMAFVGLQQDWSRWFDTFVRYRMIRRSNPLMGLSSLQARDLEAAINTNQARHEDRIEIGGTWSPAHNFMVNASFWLENTYNHTEYISFDEDSYPIVVSTWWAPDERWSFSGGFATFSNWIVQDITLGTDAAGPVPAFTAPWRYSGRADVLNLGGAFAYSPRLTLTSGFEFVRGDNSFAEPPAPEGAVPYTDLPGYSRVRVNTYRLTAGTDYRLARNMNTFFRYNYFDYDDRSLSTSFNSGTAHMFLVGLSGVY